MKLNILSPKVLLIIAATLQLHVAFAGPWISSGGDLLKDARNPWFIFNTPKINFCISIDSSTSSVSKDEVRLSIKKSLKFWRREFVENQATTVSNSASLPLTIPDFIEVDCSGRENLAILIGINTLNPQQKAFIATNHSDSVAAAIRTHYDQISLRGQGFIFIEGDKNKKSWVQNPWSESSRLTAVIAHELGHVFGVPHIQGDYASVTNQTPIPLALNLMSENLPQAAVLEATSVGFQMSTGIIPILSSMKNFDSCNLSVESAKWLNMGAEVKCLKFVLQDLNLPSDTFFYIYGIDTKGNTTLIGSLKKDGLTNPLINSKFDIITQLYITPEQNVFTFFDETESFRSNLPGGTQLYATLNMHYVSNSPNSKPKPVIINMSPNQLSVMGISGQSFISIFNTSRIRPLL